jgi:2-polyprenyl-3-methyl-5-hydroxy-6-metoxy-1,4-benzoquinol methylase
VDVTSTTEAASGSAERWGRLWGARPADWALSEDQQLPSYEEALRRVGLRPGQLVLDIGCGVGAFLRLVAERGARPFGLDASEALLDVARERVPDAELRVGEIDFVSRPSTAITRRRASRLAVMTRCRRASTP